MQSSYTLPSFLKDPCNLLRIIHELNVKVLAQGVICEIFESLLIFKSEIFYFYTCTILCTILPITNPQIHKSSITGAIQ